MSTNSFCSLLIGAASFIVLINISNKIEELKNQRPDQAMYIRKISDRIDLLSERLDDTPCNIREYDCIRERADEAEFIISAYLEQLKLFKTGKIRSGIKALHIPDWLLNDQERAFDAVNKNIEQYYEEVKYYTQEQMRHLKNSLNARSSSIIEVWCERKIRSSLLSIIDKEIAQEIIYRNGKHPDSIGYEVRKYYTGISKKDDALHQKLLDIILEAHYFDHYNIRKMIIATLMPESNKGI